MQRFKTAVAVAVLALAGTARASDEKKPDREEPASKTAPEKIELSPYKAGESWPLRNFNGLDFLEPFLPVTAIERFDFGRVFSNTLLPATFLASSFLISDETDHRIQREVERWGGWAGIDSKQDNYPVLFGLVGIAGLSVFLPSPEDRDGYSWELRADRATVFALGMGAAVIEADLLKGVFKRMRPDGSGKTSKPSGHAATAFAAMAFFSNILRDTFRPQDEPVLWKRILEEAVCLTPYLGASYVAIERMHKRKHYLTDTLLGGAIGALTMHLFYSWSFTRNELGRGWCDSISFAYNPEKRGFELAIAWSW